jgi:hypothetical protein
MYPAVKEVKPCPDYILSIVFENGERGNLDIKPILNFGLFKEIKDPQKFNQVRVSFDTVEWSCGVDLDPEYVYKKCEKSTVA